MLRNHDRALTNQEHQSYWHNVWAESKFYKETKRIAYEPWTYPWQLSNLTHNHHKSTIYTIIQLNFVRFWLRSVQNLKEIKIRHVDFITIYVFTSLYLCILICATNIGLMYRATTFYLLRRLPQIIASYFN